MESGGKTTQIFSTFKERFRTDQSSQSALASKTMFALPEQHETSQVLLVISSQMSHFLSILCYKDWYFVRGRIVLVSLVHMSLIHYRTYTYYRSIVTVRQEKTLSCQLQCHIK